MISILKLNSDMNLSVIETVKSGDINLDDLNNLYNSVGWKEREKNQLKDMIHLSSHLLIAVYEGQYAGTVRALSDGAYNAAIYDLLVDPKFQKRGIADLLMNELLNQIGDVNCIHLISTTGNESFYERHRFNKCKTGMAIFKSEALSNEYIY